jgi:hypothetical protein
MIGAEVGAAAVVAVTTRPSATAIAVLVAATLAGWVLLRRAVVVSRPARPAAVGDRRPAVGGDAPDEPPAVVALLTNGYHVPRSAATATVLDLAARRWVKFADAEGELVIFTRGSGMTGDALRPFEQQVLNHLTARSFDGVTSAGTLVASQSRLDRRWWRRFRTDVIRVARAEGLTKPRYDVGIIAPPAVLAIVALVLAWWTWRSGDDDIAVSDSIAPRLVWLVAALAAVTLAVRTATTWRSHAERPTGMGEARAAQWLGYRTRLRARIPERASVIAPPEHQLALAHALVMGVAEHLYDDVPITPEDHRWAWSDAGPTPHVVRVRYPFRPGYGRNPLMVLVAGILVLAASWWLRGFFQRVADGEALQSLLDNIPEQTDIVERVATVLAGLALVPLVWAAWAIVAGTVDSVWSRVRTGLVVRARRPAAVVPVPRVTRRLAERGRFAVFLAVDDARRTSVSAWLANERTAAPQGAYARVRATPMLGYVRSSEPVGASARRDHE